MAAEVVGIVSGGIAMAGLAGNLAKSTIALKALWDRFQHVPESIQSLLDHLEVIYPLIAEMEASFVACPTPLASMGTAASCVKLATKSLNALNGLAKDIQTNLDSTMARKRNKAKVKALLKADTMRQYQERLDAALRTLSLCLLTYNTSLLQTQPQRIAAQLEASQQQEQPVLQGNQTSTSERQQFPRLRLKDEEAPSPQSLLTWHAPSTLGSVQYRTQTWASEYSSGQTSCLRMQLPLCLAGKIWDMYFQRASSGWKMSIRPTAIFDNQFKAELHHVVLGGGTVMDVFKAVSQRGYRIHDCDDRGRTLLHNVVLWNRFDIALELVRAGASLTEVDDVHMSAFSYACYINTSLVHQLGFFRHLALCGTLEELVELPFNKFNTAPAFDWIRWNKTAIFDATATALKMDTPRPLWENIPWDVVFPETLLKRLRRNQFAESAEFVVSSANVTPSNLQNFIWRYFGPELRRQSFVGGDYTRMDDLRKLCRLVLAHVPQSRLSVPLKEGGSTPLMYVFRIRRLMTDQSSSNYRASKRILRCWLQDLQACGVDLEEYGRTEASIIEAENQHPRRLGPLGFLCMHYYHPPMLSALHYGPEPEDWTFDWDYFEPEYARDFWDSIDQQSFKVPGAWE